MDTIDSDNSDDDFEGYIDLDDSMQSSTNLHDDTHNSSHTLDEDNSTQTMDKNDNIAPLSTAEANDVHFPATSVPSSQQLPVPLPAPAAIQEAASSEKGSISQIIQLLNTQISTPTLPTAVNSPLQQLTPPSAASASQVNSQSIPVTASAPPSKLPDFTKNCGVVPDMSNKQPGDFFDLFFSDDVMANIHQETSRYAQQYLENKAEHLQQHPHSRCTAYQSKPIELREIKAALG